MEGIERLCPEAQRVNSFPPFAQNRLPPTNPWYEAALLHAAGLPAQYFSRKTFFRILPVPPLGRFSTNSTDFGILNLGQVLPAVIENFRFGNFVARLRGVMRALGPRPICQSGTAITAHSSTAGCAERTRSISAEAMFSPPLKIMSLARSTNQDITFFVDGRQVAGVEPAIADRLSRGLRLIPVACHHHVTAHDNFAHFLAVRLARPCRGCPPRGFPFPPAQIPPSPCAAVDLPRDSPEDGP